MKLRLTAVNPQRTGALVEVSIDAAPGTPLAAVAGDLTAALGLPVRQTGDGPFEIDSDLSFRCGTKTLDLSHPLGQPPLLQGAFLTLGEACDHEPDRAAVPLLALHVIAGPDAGAVNPLTSGRHSIGRAKGNTVRLADQDVSRVHAQIVVGTDQVELHDAGSTNGTWLGSERVGPSSRALAVGEPVSLGATTLALRAPDRPPAAGTPDGEGHLLINRCPSQWSARVHHQIDFPAEVPERTATRMPWPALVAPLLIAVPMAVIWRQPTFLLFAFMTPVLMLGQYLAERRSGRRDSAERRRGWEAACRERAVELEVALAADSAYLDAARPDLARLAVTAATPTDELWRARDAEEVIAPLRLGRGAESSWVSVLRQPGQPVPTREEEPRPHVLEHRDVPIAVDLHRVRVLGICGDRARALALARSLIGQACVFHSPVDVRIDAIGADPDRARDWRWVERLPHYQRHRPDDRPTAGAQPRRIVVLDGALALRRRPGVAAVLSGAARGPQRDAPRRSDQDTAPMVICLDETEQELPVECGAIVRLDQTGLLRQEGHVERRFAPDLATARWAERLSRDLAPLRDAASGQGRALPKTVRLLDLLAAHDRVLATDSDDLARHWRRARHGSPSGSIGVSAEGPFRIDLSRDGPHALVGGTTGAGKSELLQTIVAALAVGSPPDAISFLLVDYKGGAAFRGCTALPHVAGIITDLDPHLARRALASLAAELRRRERQLESAGAVDVDGYAATRSQRPQLPAMPRLVVMVDEFRVLAEELPEFVGGLIRTATVGRSLGVHLVLATQRPAGVVSPEISANANLRIALRLRDGADSRDLIDDPATALLPAVLPGRALARCGPGPLIDFQTAMVSGTTAPKGPRRPVVNLLDQPVTAQPHRADPDPGTGAPAPEAPGSQSTTGPGLGDGDLAAIARAARAAARQLDVTPVSPAWLPPLADRVELADVLALEARRVRAEQLAPLGVSPHGGARIPFALRDLPHEQRQDALGWALDGSHLAVAGGPRSGRSTLLQTLAQSAGDALEGHDLHIYVVDSSGVLTALEHFPQVEAVVAVQDVERAERLLRRLRHEITCRQQLSGTEPPGAAAPTVLLLIDGWEALNAAWSVVDHGRMIDQLMSVLRDGPAVGVQVAISGGRSMLTGSVSSLLVERIVLRFADPTDSLMAGVDPRQLGGRQPPGRGIHLGRDGRAGTEVQVAVVDPALVPRPGNSGRPGRRARTAPAVPIASQPSRGWRISALPPRLEYEQLQEIWLRQAGQTGSRPDRDQGRRLVPMGIGGDDAQALELDLDAAPVTLVIGPPGSGRTSALLCIGAGLARRGEPALMVAMTGFPGGADASAGRAVASADAAGVRARWAGAGIRVIDGRAPEAGDLLAEALAAHPDSTVLVDDVQPAGGLRDYGEGGVGGGAVEGVCAQFADQLQAGRSTALRGGRLVLACSPADLLAAYRGLPALARTAREGVLLGPIGAGDGEVFGLRLAARPPGPPGRGLLVRAGVVSALQLASPPHDASGSITGGRE